MVHVQKKQIIPKNGIQSIHFDQDKYMSIQKEVYPMGYIPPINIDPNE